MRRLCLLLSFSFLMSLQASQRPNVVIFLVDDLGSGELPCYRSRFHETPHIDALAEQGLRFTHAYSASTLCSPSRAALLTGCSPARLHLTDWIPGQVQINRRTLTPDWKTYIDPERILLPEALKAHGYATCFAGKWHLVPRPRPMDLALSSEKRLAAISAINAMYEKHMPENSGFDENHGGDHSPNQGGHFFYPKYHKFPGLKGKGNKGKCLTDVLTDCAIDFLGRTKNQPFLLYLSYYTVHNPITGKPDYVAKYKRKLAAYPDADFKMKHPGKAAMVQSLDDSVGRVMAKLKEMNQLEKTLVIFTGDNGSQGDEFVPDFRGNKGTAYEGGTRVPLLIRGPGIAPGVSHEPTIAMDLYPTILESLGLPLLPKAHQDGVSIVPLLQKGSGAQGKTMPKRNLYWHYPHYDETTPYSSLIADDWKVIRYADDGKVEVYHLETDPMEKKDLSSSHPEKTEALLAALDRELAAVNAQAAVPNPEFDPNQFSGGIRAYRRLKGRKK